MMSFRQRRRAKKFWAYNAWMESRMRETAVSLPLFGLTGWSGLRMAGLWTFTEDWQAETASLRHGDPNDVTAKNMLVCTTRFAPDQLVKQLQHDHALLEGQVDQEVSLAARRRTPGPAATGAVEIIVDGQTRTFQRWEQNDRWQAACQLDEHHALVLDAHHFDPADVALVQVHDLEACLTDRRNWIKAYYD
jgi:hypothetical protein